MKVIISICTPTNKYLYSEQFGIIKQYLVYVIICILVIWFLGKISIFRYILPYSWLKTIEMQFIFTCYLVTDLRKDRIQVC